MENRYFEWEDAKQATARELAALFVQRAPEIGQASEGRDWLYAGWFAEMLGFVDKGELPIAYSDWYEAPDPRWLPTSRGFESGLPMPPPGEAEPDVR